MKLQQSTKRCRRRGTCFLTKNGRGRYALIDIADYERTQAVIRLMREPSKGQKSGEEKGRILHDDV